MKWKMISDIQVTRCKKKKKKKIKSNNYQLDTRGQKCVRSALEGMGRGTQVLSGEAPHLALLYTIYEREVAPFKYLP